MKILIIEDSDLKYECVKEFLDKQGITSNRGKSFTSGMYLLVTNQYDGIFLDMQFPLDDDGYSLSNQQGMKILREMKRKKINIPVCIHSSFTHLNFDEESLVKQYIKYDYSIYLDNEYQKFIDIVKKEKNYE